MTTAKDPCPAEAATPAAPARHGAALKAALFAAAGGLCFHWTSPPAALAVGAALAVAVGNPFRRAAHEASKHLLQLSVVLLGFGMNLPAVLRVGAHGAVFAAGTIGATLALGHVLGRWLKTGGMASALISVGTAICGGSAIAAVASATGAAEGEITVAMGTVFLLNAVAIYAFPPLGHALHLTQAQFGTWAGVAIHDTSSVVSAGAAYGAAALETATAVKLSRALWIVPVSLAAAAARRAKQAKANDATAGAGAGPGARPRIQVPWFIGLFLLASLVRSFVPAVAAAAPTLARAAATGITLALFLIGAALSRQSVAALGWRPLAQGTALWVFISAVSLAVIVWAQP